MSNDKTNVTPRDDTPLRQGGPDTNAGFVADDEAGESSIGHPGNSQSGINSNFAKASPDSNVGPAGAEQSSYGQAHPPGQTRGKPWPEQNSQSAIDQAKRE